MLADYHVHTEFSDDSVYDMEDCIKHAIELNLDEICFTDHVDYGVKKDWSEGNIEWRNNEPIANVDYPKYYEKFEQMKQKYKNKITLKLGLEFGIQTHTIPKFQKLYNSHTFDFIILSIHQVRDLEFWNGDYQRGKSQKEYNDEYYEELLNVVKNYKDYSVLGHLDLIQRYDPAGYYPFEKNKEIITEILKTVIKDGKGIEVNTSSHRYKLLDTQPSRAILKLYKELGGTIITIGSDSHKEEHLGAYIQDTMDLLKELGYTDVCTFDKMKPIFHKL